MLALSIISSQTEAAQSTSTPVKDIIELCSHQTGGRAKVVDSLVQRGWENVSNPVPVDMPLIMADGELIHTFFVPGANFSGVSTKTAVIPEMTNAVEALLAAQDRGVFDVLWRAGNNKALLLVHDGLNEHEDLRCRLYGTTEDGASEILSTFEKFNSDGFQRKGPVTAANAYFRGYPPHQPLTGFLGLLVKFRILVDRPVLEPQIGAGVSDITLHFLDADEFVNRFDRQSHASFILWVARHSQSEKTK
ncbi:hypothetical protein [Phaeobacter piscinae]|uniref:hypothetical protein n=1 Tax=Phaeobacter piscinae TaxID=1580596 RepID=UPI000F49062C|nr:hypothetical protein [Phaeobacter piscinae]